MLFCAKKKTSTSKGAFAAALSDTALTILKNIESIVNLVFPWVARFEKPVQKKELQQEVKERLHIPKTANFSNVKVAPYSFITTCAANANLLESARAS